MHLIWRLRLGAVRFELQLGASPSLSCVLYISFTEPQSVGFYSSMGCGSLFFCGIVGAAGTT